MWGLARALHGCRPQIAILCWSWIKPSLLEKYVAVYLFQVNSLRNWNHQGYIRKICKYWGGITIYPASFNWLASLKCLHGCPQHQNYQSFKFSTGNKKTSCEFCMSSGIYSDYTILFQWSTPEVITMASKIILTGQMLVKCLPLNESLQQEILREFCFLLFFLSSKLRDLRKAY